MPAATNPTMLIGSLARTVLRGVGQFRLLQVEDGHPRLDRQGQHVDPLVHAVAADRLGTEDSPVVGGEEDLQGDRPGTGHVAGVVVGVDVDLAEGQPGTLQRLLRGPGHRRRLVEDAHDRRPLGPPIAGVLAAEDVVGGESALAVRRAGQGDLGRTLEDEILDLDGVPDRIDVRVLGLEVVVDPRCRPEGRRPARRRRPASSPASRPRPP